MAVGWAAIQEAVGRTLTPEEQRQAEIWEQDALLIIKSGFLRRGWDFSAVNGATLDMVVREAVSERIKYPSAKRTSHEVSVDDGRVVERYEAATGQIEILDSWWDLLAPVVRWRRSSFTIRPAYEPDRRNR